MDRRREGAPVHRFWAWRALLDNVGEMRLENVAFMLMTSHPAISMFESTDKVLPTPPVDPKMEVTGVCIPLFDICYP